MTATVPARKTATKKTTKRVDWAAVMMRAGRRGLQIVPVSLADWPRAIGTDTIDGSRVRLVLDGNVIWMGDHATVGCLEVALQEADPINHPPFLVRPAEVVEIGCDVGDPSRVLRRTPQSKDVDVLLGL